MNIVNKILCKLGHHIYDPDEVENGWTYRCIHCGNLVKVMRPINFQQDIKPLLEKHNLKGMLNELQTSFDNMLIVIADNGMKASCMIPGLPMYDGDIYLSKIFDRILYNIQQTKGQPTKE